MAGNWIKFDTSTSDKPEVWAMSESLGIDPDAVVGKLLRVWAWFDDQTEKGNAPIVTRALLDRKVGVTGFVTAMVEAGWMVEADGVLTLPNFDRHNGQTAKNRILTAKRVAAHKKGNASGNAKGNAAIVTGALPKEEKSRSEKRDTKVSLSECFETWWSSYPKKASKGTAAKAYAKAIGKFAGTTEEAAAALLDASLPRFEELAKREVQFIPHAATWLNADGWTDDVASSEPPKKPASRVFRPGPDWDGGDIYAYARSKGHDVP